MREKIKKLSCIQMALLLIALVFAGNFWRINQRYTIVQDEQDTHLGTTYGYRVENYTFKKGVRITIWVKIGPFGRTTMQSVYDLPELTVDKVEKSEWVKSNRAIYLNLQITYIDSSKSTRPVRIIYDFHTGEMYVTSEFTLWRIWGGKLSPDDWLTNDEFDQQLKELQE